MAVGKVDLAAISDRVNISQHQMGMRMVPDIMPGPPCVQDRAELRVLRQ